MKRKIIKQGMGGFTISIPVDWARSRQLKPGDELEVTEQDGALLISGIGNTSKKKSISIEHDDKKLLRTLISAYYRQGYYELTLNFNKPQSLAFMQDIIESLRGYEPIPKDKQHYTIRDVSREENEPSDNLITRLFQQINLLFEEMMLAKEPGSDNQEIEILRKNIMKSRDYAQRTIRLEGKEDSFERYALVLSAEKIAGEYYYLAKNKHPLKKDAIEQINQVHRLVQSAQTTFNSKNFSKANSTYIEIKKFIDEQKKENEKTRARSNNAIISASEIICHNLLIIASRLQIITALSQDSSKA